MANFPQLGMRCHGIKFDKFDIDIVRDNPKVLGGRNRSRSIVPKREWAQLYQEKLGGRDRCCNSRKRFVYFNCSEDELRALRLEAGIKIQPKIQLR